MLDWKAHASFNVTLTCIGPSQFCTHLVRLLNPVQPSFFSHTLQYNFFSPRDTGCKNKESADSLRTHQDIQRLILHSEKRALEWRIQSTAESTTKGPPLPFLEDLCKRQEPFWFEKFMQTAKPPFFERLVEKQEPPFFERFVHTSFQWEAGPAQNRF